MADDTTASVPVKMYGTKEVAYALIDAEDYQRVCRRNWGAQPTIGYAYRKDITYNAFDGTSSYTMVLMHRFLIDAPDGMQVDHINGNRLDNRKSNLRICTQEENLTNRIHLETFRGRPTQSQYKGVSFTSGNPNRPNPWRATIAKGGKSYYLGSFPAEVLAAMAYNEAATRLHGEFARLNVITE